MENHTSLGCDSGSILKDVFDLLSSTYYFNDCTEATRKMCHELMKEYEELDAQRGKAWSRYIKAQTREMAMLKVMDKSDSLADEQCNESPWHQQTETTRQRHDKIRVRTDEALQRWLKAVEQL